MRYVSLFSGGGGLDLGFERAGWEPVVCVDNDPVACQTLSLNRPKWHVVCDDIRNFDARPFEGTDVVIGGPPCQGFSTAGKGDPADPRNFLWREYMRVVSEVRPRALVLENVSALTHRRNGDHLSGIMQELEKQGYTFAYGVLNAADYGVPQARRRLIVIGVLDGVASLPQPTTAGAWPTVWDAIGDLAGLPDDPDFSHVANRHAAHVVDRWRHLGPGETDPNYRRARLDPNRPSLTIRAGGGYGPSGNHLAGFHPPIHPTLPRQLTVREAARLQSFPDDWMLCGPKTIQGRQIGNAVPVNLGEAIGLHLAALLESQHAHETVLA
ncbi:DNA (cytosine-5-)-methyltransferase [Microbacterium sp. SYP-A9085]|uniref:DNA cytosine methyltransferase n=1 Tax=Microbacterium sp. SYP-A9085 TaxID=2664454 RepID=UPI00129B1DDE|nr:DNA cytosine methyltransferase [Microbacterium sp. SYP-A9085]MRH28428.1 DNA (cytosine-5-)-methyltransferase [Microbacterium sp. SYP-A9085]